jgi:hypothetical protein
LKVLIAILSCARDSANGFNQAVRDTWGRHVEGADLRFFLGSAAKPRSHDEVILQVGDEYLDLPHKSRALQRWIVQNGYDFTYKCDTDTFVVPEKLLASGFNVYDYIGVFNGPLGVPDRVDGGWMKRPSGREGRFYAWPSGGSGYWVSAKASRLIAEAEEVDDYAEDRWVGQVLGPRIPGGYIRACHDPRYGWGFDRENYHTEISSHFGRSIPGHEYSVEWMMKHYEANGRS